MTDPGIPPEKKKKNHRPPATVLTADDGSSPVFDTKGTCSEPQQPSARLVRSLLKGVHNGIEKSPRWRPTNLVAASGFPTRTIRLAHQLSFLVPSAAPCRNFLTPDRSLPRRTVERRRYAALDSGQRTWLPESTTQWTAGLVSGSTCENDNRPKRASSRPRSRPRRSRTVPILGPSTPDLDKLHCLRHPGDRDDPDVAPDGCPVAHVGTLFASESPDRNAMRLRYSPTARCTPRGR